MYYTKYVHCHTLAQQLTLCYHCYTMTRRFEEINHTADIAIRVWGIDLAELFRNAAYGMASQLAEPDRVPIETSVTLDLEAADVELLLVRWLSELLYLGEEQNVIFTDFDVLEVKQTVLRAIARGGHVPHLHHHIKAVTFSELDVKQIENGYETTVVFDV